MQWTSAYVVLFHVITFSNSIAGNPMICGVNSGDNCSSVSLDPLSYPPDNLKSEFLFILFIIQLQDIHFQLRRT
jgi:hypothetical protein